MKNRFSRPKMLACAVVAATVFCGCGSSDNFVHTSTFNPTSTAQPPVLQAPVAVDDTFPALGNATLNQHASGVLANDTPNGGSITAFDSAGSEGGTLDLKADGSFTYTPAANYVGPETFNYTLSNEEGESTATVTLTSTGLGRFVDNSGSNGDGTQNSPFNNLQDALNAAQPGDTIYVASGDGTNTGVPGGFTLPAGVKLIGEGTGLVLAQTVEPAGTAPIISGPITCLGDNVIQGFAIDGSSAEGIVATSVANLTISQNSFANIAEEHIEFSSISGTVTIDGNDFLDVPTGRRTDNIYFEQIDTDGSFVCTGNTFRNAEDAATNILCELGTYGTSSLSVVFSRNEALGNASGGFENGFYWFQPSTGACTLSAQENSFSNLSNDGFNVDGPVRTTLAGNTFNACAFPIFIDFGGTDWNISGNLINDSLFPMTVFNSTADGTCVISNNRLTGAEERAVTYEAIAPTPSNAKVALRDNSVTGCLAEAVYIHINQDNRNVCFDISGNTVDGDMLFEDSGNGSITVEQFGDAGGDELKSVNNFISGADVVVNGDAVVDAIAGFCQIP